MSATQLAQLLNNNSSLLSIPAFVPLSHAVQQIKQVQQKKCNCKGGGINPFVQLRSQVEATLSRMSSDDWIKTKSLLHIDELCYYKKDSNNKMIQICL